MKKEAIDMYLKTNQIRIRQLDKEIINFWDKCSDDTIKESLK